MPSQEPPPYNDAVAAPAQRERASTTTSLNPATPLTRAGTTPATTATDTDVGASQRRSQRRASLQPLPAYTRERADDPNYIGALEQWAQTKMYVVPGQDGTFCSMGWGTVAGKNVDRAGEERKRMKEMERLERLRRGSRVEGDGGGEGSTVPRAERRGSGIRNMLRRLSTR